jgi:hypothetical protein
LTVERLDSLSSANVFQTYLEDTPASPPLFPPPTSLNFALCHPATPPLLPGLPTRSVNFGAHHRAVQPVGIIARQHHIAATEHEASYKNRVEEPVKRALEILGNKCMMCWMSHKRDWYTHISDNCTHHMGTNFGDAGYTSF